MPEEKEPQLEKLETETPQKITSKKIDYFIKIPETEGLVFTDKGVALQDKCFVSEENESEEVPEIFRRPLMVTELNEQMFCEESETAFDVKSTIAMGKAAFVEYPTNVDGTDYNFVLWKGSGSNKVIETLAQTVASRDGKIDFPLGKDGLFPLSIIDLGEGKHLERFIGAAYYHDLLAEERQSKKIKNLGLRMPKIVATFKFSREFCKKHNLPIPENDEPNNDRGETLRQFIDKNKNSMSEEKYEKLKTLHETEDYPSAILGQNVRVFRNVWRVSELEEATKEKDESKRQKKISAILQTSKAILSIEFKVEMNDKEFLKNFSLLLGQQVFLLLKNRIIQGAMNEHKQDITLAAELCDFDGAYQLNNEYFDDPKNLPGWVKDTVTWEKWVEEQRVKLTRQILLVGSHIKPVIDAVNAVGANQGNEAIIDLYSENIASNLSDNEKKGY